MKMRVLDCCDPRLHTILQPTCTTEHRRLHSLQSTSPMCTAHCIVLVPPSLWFLIVDASFSPRFKNKWVLGKPDSLLACHCCHKRMNVSSYTVFSLSFLSSLSSVSSLSPLFPLCFTLFPLVPLRRCLHESKLNPLCLLLFLPLPFGLFLCRSVHLSLTADPSQ